MLRAEHITQVESLDNDKAGILLKAIYRYANGRELPEMDGMTMMAFSFIRDQIDRDNEKYWRTVEARREAGKKGGRPPKANAFLEKQEEAKKANGFFDKQNNPDKDKEKDKDIIEDNIKILADAKAMFERLWKLYPNKKGKGQVSDTQKKRLLAIGEPTLVKAIERYSLELQKDADWRKPQNGSTFFNSGYVDYLDENYVPGEQAEKKTAPAGGNKFNNFPQRTYDYENLEKQLLNADKGGN